MIFDFCKKICEDRRIKKRMESIKIMGDFFK